MKNDKKTIKFGLDKSLYDINPPLSAKKYIPSWFKDSSKFFNSDNPNILAHGKTFKACVPFADAMLSGYIFELWSDINVVNYDGFQKIMWRDDRYVILGERDSRQSGNMPIPTGYSDVHYALRHPLFIKTPPGYSILITQPFNRFDLPFMALTGIVDSDKEPFFPGNYSLFLKENFSGVIEKGTPLFQIIPFKRDEWLSDYDEGIIDQGLRASNKSARKIIGWYRDNVWSKKSYS